MLRAARYEDRESTEGSGWPFTRPKSVQLSPLTFTKLHKPSSSTNYRASGLREQARNPHIEPNLQLAKLKKVSWASIIYSLLLPPLHKLMDGPSWKAGDRYAGLWHRTFDCRPPGERPLEGCLKDGEIFLAEERLSFPCKNHAERRLSTNFWMIGHHKLLLMDVRRLDPYRDFPDACETFAGSD